MHKKAGCQETFARGTRLFASRAKENYLIRRILLSWLSYLACRAAHRLINAFCIAVALKTGHSEAGCQETFARGTGLFASRAKENYVIRRIRLSWFSYLACRAVHRLINAFCIAFA